MAIEIKFKIEGNDELFDNPMDCVKQAAFISQSRGGEGVKMWRGVKYMHSTDYRWTSIGNIELPLPLTNSGPVAYDNKGESAVRSYVEGLRR